MVMIQLNALRLNAVDANIIALDGVRRRGSHAGAPPVVPDVPDVPDIPEEPDVPTNPDVDENGYIIFADPEVARICAENWGDGTGITLEQAASVTRIGTKFANNEFITKFNELQRFENVINFGYYGGGTTSDAAFYKCSNLEHIALPPRLNSISYSTFEDCVNLDFDLGKLPKTIKYIQKAAFLNCTKVYGYIDLPELIELKGQSFCGTSIDGVLNLGNITGTGQGYRDRGAFTSSTLRFAILPESITEIGYGTFANTPLMEALVVKAMTPPPFLGGTPFYNCPATFYVPDASVAAYRETSGWADFASRIFPVSQLSTDNPDLHNEIKDYL